MDRTGNEPEPVARPQVPEVNAAPVFPGLAEAEARHVLIRAGFTVQTVDQPTSDPGENGVVVKQKPAAGRQVAVGSQIVIYVGRLPAPTG